MTVLSDLKPANGGEVILLANGFGGTPLMELYLMFNAARPLIEGHGLNIARSLVGNYVTSLEMAGCSLTITALDDDIKKLWDAPVHTASLRWGCCKLPRESMGHGYGPTTTRCRRAGRQETGVGPVC